MKPAAPSLLVGLALLAGCGGCGGGGHAAPDGGDALGDLGIEAIEEVGGVDNAIVVGTPSGVMATGARDGICDLLEAAAAASSGQTVGDCANPKGLSRIVLGPGNTYPLNRTARLSGAAEIGIADGATGSATIEVAPGFIVDTGDPTSSCLISVADVQAQVWLRDVTLREDLVNGPSVSGACVTIGMLSLRRAQVTGFRAGGIVATCLPASGCDHAADIQQSTTLTVLSSLVDGNRNANKGGGISSEGPGTTVLVAHSAIVNNSSDNDGGGLYLGGGWGTDIIQASTISGNTTSGVGGGILVRFAEMTLTYVNVFGSTIANNFAVGSGGGIEFEPATAGMQDVAVFSSIVAGNFSTSTLEWNINASWSEPATPGGIAGTFNCVDDSFIYVTPGNPLPTDMGGCTFDVRNPFLGPLMSLGGVGDLPLHPLLAGSPTVDATRDGTREDQRDPWIDNVDPGTPADWTVFDPLVDGDGDGTAKRDLGATERDDRWQTELLDVRAHGTSAQTIVTLPAGYDRGAGAVYAATSATNEYITYALPVAEAGHYDVTVGVRRDTDAGTFQIAIADNPAGPWTPIGPEQDDYGTASAFASLGPFAAPLFTAPGEKLVRFTVTGNNPASGGHRLYLDFIQLNKSTAPCPVADVAAGGSHTCAIMSGSAGVRCWGGDANGQLGDGDGLTNDHPRPPAADAATGATAVAAGSAHTCAIFAGGNLVCWGQNDRGQLGDGTKTTRTATTGQTVLAGVKAVAAGRAHTCALTTAGGVRCWGANEFGQLGDGTLSDRSTPPSIDALTGIKAISAGGTHTCALTTAGGVRCWGANGHGQLGDGTTDDRSTPPATDAAIDIASLSAGDTHTCAITNAGGLRCWGHNGDGEIGIGNYDLVLSPPSSDVLSGIKQVAAGNLFTCALSNAGGVRCWGYNSHGEIGDDTVIAVDRLRPATVDILGGVASLSAGLTHVCARMTGGGVRCWGGNDNGQLGDGMAPIFALTPPTMDTLGFTGTCN